MTASGMICSAIAPDLRQSALRYDLSLCNSYLYRHFGLASLPGMHSNAPGYGSGRLRIDYEFRIHFQDRKPAAGKRSVTR